MKIRRTAVTAALALSAGITPADTYYVRTSGSDGNSGTSPSQAWASIEHAVENVSAGDVVYVGAGTYTDEAEPDGNGTSGNPIRMVADTSGTQTGDAGTVTMRRNGRLLEVDNADYWTFEGFTFERSNPSGEAVKVEDSTGIVFTDCVFIGADKCVKLKDSTVTILNATVTGMKKEGIEVDGGSVTLTNVTLDDSSNDDKTIELKGGATFTIDRCRILDGDDGIYVDDATGTITNTLIADTTGDIDDGIKVNDNQADVRIINCTIWGIGDDGLDVDNGDAYVRNTIFSDIGGNCMEGSGSDIDANTNLMWQYGGSRSSGFNSPNENYYDPRFTNEGSHDFTLQDISGAIDDGLDMSSYTTTDIDGGSRPNGSAYDLGAFEYGAASYVAADIPYSTDFATVGDEWVDEIEGYDSDVGDFIGRYGDVGGVETGATLYLNTTPGMTYTVQFDLLTIDSWDGDHTTWGPDGIHVYVDSAEAFWETFVHEHPFDQSYPSPANTTGNWGWASWADGIYEDVSFTFVATGTETEIEWIGEISEDISNESWALLAVDVFEDPPLFVDVTSTAGFGVDTNAALHDGSGWHWADFDGDGDLDAFVSGASAYLLRQNVATGAFTPYAIGNVARGTAMFDPDGDGDPDLFNGDSSSIALLENLGGFLVDRGDCGVDGPSNAEGALAIDIDADGTCEIVVLSQGGNFIATNMGAGHLGYSPVGFEDAEDAADGLNDSGDYGNGDYASTADVNNDGYLDIFYNYGSGKLFVSNGDGTYTEGTLGISAYVDNSYKFGSSWGDYDNDGDMDLFVPDARDGEPGALWRNASAGTAFTDNTVSAGMTASYVMLGSAWGDYDNDGDLDLYVATGSGTPNLLYTNDGSGSFTVEDQGAGLTDEYQDVVFVDYDADGDLDIALSRLDGDGRAVLLQNQTDNDQYLKVRLVGGNGINSLAIGARIELYDQTGATLLGTREVGAARGFGGTEPLWAHFGGVDPDTPYQIRVVWPGGQEQSASVTPSAVSTTIGSTTIDQMITIEGNIASGARFVRWRETDPTE